MHAFHAAHFEYRNDVRVIQTRGGARLGQEAGHRAAVAGKAADDELHRDLTPEAQLPCTKYDAHTAAADALEQFVVAKATIVRISETCFAEIPASTATRVQPRRTTSLTTKGT